jgi:putative tryptophan/tyrosine transport system substrate-binding protein
MRRRQFIGLLGGALTAWPLVARAQGEPKRLGVLMASSATDPTGQSQVATFMEGLRKLGWIEGQNLRSEVRWTAANPSLIQAYATDLVALLKPDVLVANTTANLLALRGAAGTIPIVFTAVADPVEQGFVQSLTHPGGNITGFASNEFSIAGKWADLLKQMAPSVARVVYIYNPETGPQSERYANALDAGARVLGLEVMPTAVHSTADIEAALARLAGEPNVGLIFSPGTFLSLRAKVIVEAVARIRIPAIYGSTDETFVTEGGLMQYTFDVSEQFRLAPFYIDRILKGGKPADLPVHFPTKFKFIVNRKTARALGIDVPLEALLAADEVIE